jgi:hypothetical protein
VELAERMHWSLNCGRRGPSRKNRKAEEMANGITGPLNQYERYFAGLKL